MSALFAAELKTSIGEKYVGALTVGAKDTLHNISGFGGQFDFFHCQIFCKSLYEGAGMLIKVSSLDFNSAQLVFVA